MTMTPKTRTWVAITLFVIIAINYVIFAVPLVRKQIAVQKNYKMILADEAKPKYGIFKATENDYLLEVLGKEKAALGRSFMILNSIFITLNVVVLSWVAFGLLARRKQP